MIKTERVAVNINYWWTTYAKNCKRGHKTTDVNINY
jgi:hypothetical protein